MLFPEQFIQERGDRSNDDAALSGTPPAASRRRAEVWGTDGRTGEPPLPPARCHVVRSH